MVTLEWIIQRNTGLCCVCNINTLNHCAIAIICIYSYIYMYNYVRRRRQYSWLVSRIPSSNVRTHTHTSTWRICNANQEIVYIVFHASSFDLYWVFLSLSFISSGRRQKHLRIHITTQSTLDYFRNIVRAAKNRPILWLSRSLLFVFGVCVSLRCWLRVCVCVCIRGTCYGGIIIAFCIDLTRSAQKIESIVIKRQCVCVGVECAVKGSNELWFSVLKAHTQTHTHTKKIYLKRSLNKSLR